MKKSYVSPRPPPKISFRHDHDWTRGNDELGSAVEQQPVGKLVQQSCGEVQHAKFSKPTQPKPKPICDRSGKPDNLSENIRVKHAHDGTGQLVEQNSSSAHTVKEQFALEENRDIASFNTDNEFNRAINEENIDFNIPGLPHSAVVNVQNLIQKIENHPQRHALQSDLQQHRQFNPFSKESQDVIKQLETLNCVNYSMLNPKHSAKYVCRTGTSASSTARAVTSCEMIRERTRSTSSSLLTSFRFPTATSRKDDPTATATGRKKGITSTSSRISSRRNARRENS